MIDTLLSGLLSATLAIGDRLFGWLLHLPPVAAVAVLGILTSLLMSLARRWTTNQDLLGRAHADKRRLKVLTREAKAAKDKKAVSRYRTTSGEIALKLMRAEGKPLLTVLLPLILMGTWGWYRLGYLPPQENELVQVELSLPASAIGSVAFLVPHWGIDEPEKGYVVLVEEAAGDVPAGVAKWTVSGQASPEPYTLVLNHGDRRFQHDLLVGQRTYAAELVMHEPGRTLPQSFVRMRVPKIAGIFPGPHPDDWGGYGAWFPSWVITYFLFVLPFYFITKRLFRVY